MRHTPHIAHAPSSCPFFPSEVVVGAPEYSRRRQISSGRQKPLGGRLKRSLDVLISLSLLVLLAPLFIIILCLIYLTMGRPIFFSHERVGFLGVPFKCYKFRTMVHDAGRTLHDYLRDNPAAVEEWRAFQKLKNDPRITPIGALLRKSSLDELPQLFNIMRGDMTCVGPRPVTGDEISRYKTSARYYIKTRPGLTGLWQVRGRSNTSYSSRVALDRQYVAGWTIWLDVKILVETVPAVFRFHETI